MKYATLISLVSANWRLNRDLEHHHCLRKWMWEPVECEAEPYNMDKSENLKDWDLVRKAGYTIHSSIVKGAYHKQGHVIDDKCFGNWMEEKRPLIDSTWMKLRHGDIWGVSHDDIKESVSALWDDLFLNMDTCESYHIYYNKYNWCMNNIGDCYYGDALLENIFTHGFDIIGPITNLWNMAMEDDTCETDTRTLQKLDRAITEVASIWSYLHGFDAKWENFEEVPKLTFHEMHHNIHNKIKEEGRGCPVMGPLRKVGKEIDAFFAPLSPVVNVNTHSRYEPRQEYNPFFAFQPLGLQMPHLF